MAQSSKKVIETEITVLTKSKSVFKKELTERINKGEKIIKSTANLFDTKRQFSDWNDYNMELLKQSFNIPLNEYHHSYKGSGGVIRTKIISKYSITGLGQDLSQLISKIKAKIDNLVKLNNKVDLLKLSVEETITKIDSRKELNMSQVFIVHGHHEEAKTKTARFIEKLGFEAIILHEKASSSKTIIEKIEEYSDVGFGIVLYTPCDIGGKQTKEPTLTSRARQNVVFEHGFLIGKIGRSNVCALIKGDVEIPNDISGVVYISMDQADAWKYTVAKELKKAGYSVDMNKI